MKRAGQRLPKTRGSAPARTKVVVRRAIRVLRAGRVLWVVWVVLAMPVMVRTTATATATR